jgi:CHRD domain/PEP-CTERM motif
MIRREEMKKTLFALAAMSLVAAAPVQAAILLYSATLSGPAEAPPNASPGTGFATVSFDTVTNLLTLNVTFSGLTGTVTASHIHCCTTVAGTGTAGVATETPTFGGFPLGVTSGTYSHTFDMTSPPSYNPAFITANGGTTGSAFTAFLTGMNSGKAYLNIHSTAFGGGEIRGFVTPVPEPASWMMMLAGFGLVGMAMRSADRPRYRVKYS